MIDMELAIFAEARALFGPVPPLHDRLTTLRRTSTAPGATFVEAALLDEAIQAARERHHLRALAVQAGNVRTSSDRRAAIDELERYAREGAQ